jgi:environmental stress-induced protein Ves
MRHLTASDYRVMPWANRRGTTTEMIRVDRDGTLDWRLSMAQVVEDGPFSRLPGVARNLTVIAGPGFDLVGPGLRLRAAPLEPVAFSGDLEIRAEGVTGPSVDFNVMVAGRPPQVRLLRGAEVLDPGGAVLCVLALQVAGLARHDLLICDQPVAVEGQALAVWIQSR